MNGPRAAAQAAIAALIGLIALHVVMLGALFGHVAPSPPPAWGPYIGATAALAALTVPLVWWGRAAGNACALAVALMGLVSVGPHKFVLDPAASVLSPVLVLGTMLVVVLVAATVADLRRPRRDR